MKRSVVAIALVLLLGTTFAQPTAAQDGREVWAYYMGFWFGPPTWNSSLLTDQPARGFYDVRDAGTVGAQIDEARTAGIDAFVVNWRNNPQEDAAMNAILGQAGARGFEAGISIDSFNGANRDTIVSAIQRAQGFMGNGAYLRYDGKPVLFFAFQNNAGLSAAQWLEIRNQLDPGRSQIWIAEGLSGCCIYNGAMDGMWAFNLAWANGASGRFATERNAVLNRGGTYYIPTVHPGWDENLVAAATGRSNPTAPRARNNGQFLRTSFTNASAISDVVLIVSWNEYYENSHIEPSTAYGSQSLDTLRPLVAAWKGNTPAPAANQPAAAPTGRSLQSTVNLNVRSGPGTNFNRIGQIAPGTPYSITGEQAGWFSFDFNGQVGWVSRDFVTVSGTASAQPAGAGAAVETGITFTTSFNANVRSAPSTSSATLGTASFQSVLPATGRTADNTWVRVNFEGQSGWISLSLGNLSGAVNTLPVAN